MESEFTAHLLDMMHDNMWGVYLCLLIAPFLQEDAAVIGAASLSLASMGDNWLILLFITLGLSCSDLWKYWLGRAARTQGWAKRFAQKPGVAKAERLVQNNLGRNLMAVRFVPGTRIVFYIASGYFEASWPRFAFWVIFSAIIYIILAFALFHAVGMVAGEAARIWLPAVALAALLVYLLIRKMRGAKQES
ncbi:MAG: VTT domain-containing protein [Pseudomonadota bacterium]